MAKLLKLNQHLNSAKTFRGFFGLTVNQKGFTLIEILVALVLVSLIIGVAVSDPFSQRKNLEEDLDQIERGLRYMSDEAALKNTVVRLRVLLNKEPHEWAIEYGPSENFVLPQKEELGAQTESLEEEEERKKEEKAINMNFNRISDFNESNTELKDNVKFVAIATRLTGKLQNKGEANVYAFPGGEQDEAIIMLHTEEEIATLELEAFSSTIKRSFYSLQDRKEEDFENKIKGLSEEIYNQWVNKK